MLPKYTETFYYPLGTIIESVTCDPVSTRVQQLENQMFITPHPIRLTDNTLVHSEENQYQRNEPYPSSWYSYRNSGGLIGNELRTILTIDLYPVRYTASNNEIMSTEVFELSIDVSLPEKDHVTTTATGETYDFLILGKSEFQEEIEPLVTHKKNRNISTIFVPLYFVYNSMYFPTNGRDEAEQIKYFIKNAIESWEVRNVMLVGGRNEFPTRTTHVFIADNPPYEPELFVSDLYYADIYDAKGNFSCWDSNNNDLFGEYNWEGRTDEVDMYPDVHLGRLAVTSKQELAGVINKIISYENQEAYKQEWFSNLVLIGGDTFPGDPNAISEGEYLNDAILDVMTGFSPDKLYASLGRLSVNGYITNAIHEGAGFVSFAGHGNPTSWSTHPHEKPNIWIPTGGFRNQNALNLENSDKLPIIAISACSVAQFNVNDKTLTWSLVSNPNGGAIAAFGTTSLGYGSWGTATTQRYTGKMLLDTFRAYRTDGAITFGEIWTRGLNRYISSRLNSVDYKTIQQWQPFGDPTLAIAEESKPPVKPVVSGPSSAKAGEEVTFEVTTTDPDGDDVYYLFDWGDGTFSEWLGPYDSGRTVSASYTWSTRGDFGIRAVAKDDHGVIGEWSDPFPVTMPRSFSYFSRLTQFFERFFSFSFF